MESLELCDVIKYKNVAREKDLQAMSILFCIVLEKIMHELDVEKTTKKTWKTLNVKRGSLSKIS